MVLAVITLPSASGAQEETAWEKIVGPWSADCDTSFGAIASHPTNPSIIYIGSTHPTNGCGIYRSPDGGKTWSPKNNGLVQFTFTGFYPAITKIVISLNNPDILYAGTYTDSPLSGPAGRIYRSVDGGNTWEDARGRCKFFLCQIKQGVLDLSIDPKDPNTVFAALALRGIYKTTDGGKNWINVQKASPGNVDFYSIVRVSPPDSSIIYISGFASLGGVAVCVPPYDCIDLNGVLPIGPFKSLDEGETFLPTPRPKLTALLTDIAVHPSEPNTLYASTTTYMPGIPIPVKNKGVFKSTDGGITWKAVNSAGTTSLSQFPIYKVIIDQGEPTIIYAVAGFEGIFKSTNGGDEWEQMPTSGLPANTFIGNLGLAGQSLQVCLVR